MSRTRVQRRRDAKRTRGATRRTLAAALSAALFSMPLPGWACGACIEDKVAATYDHAVVRAAIEAHRQVIFVALDGRDAARIADRLASAAAAVPGAQRGSVRFATAPPAFSFALARDVAPATALAGFRKAAAGMDVRMSVVRVMRDGALVDP